MEVSQVKACNRANDLVLRVVEARSIIHSTLSWEYGLNDKPSEPKLVFRRLQTEVAKKEEALRISTAEVGTLQALLDTKRQSFTLSPTLERELVQL